MGELVKTVYAVIDGMVVGIIAFEKEADAQTWAKTNQEGGEALGLDVKAVSVYPDVASAPKHPEFF
jgi:hypothetical protein